MARDAYKHTRIPDRRGQPKKRSPPRAGGRTDARHPRFPVGRPRAGQHPVSVPAGSQALPGEENHPEHLSGTPLRRLHSYRSRGGGQVCSSPRNTRVPSGCPGLVSQRYPFRVEKGGGPPPPLGADPARAPRPPRQPFSRAEEAARRLERARSNSPPRLQLSSGRCCSPGRPPRKGFGGRGTGRSQWLPGGTRCGPGVRGSQPRAGRGAGAWAGGAASRGLPGWLPGRRPAARRVPPSPAPRVQLPDGETAAKGRVGVGGGREPEGKKGSARILPCSPPGVGRAGWPGEGKRVGEGVGKGGVPPGGLASQQPPPPPQPPPPSDSLKQTRWLPLRRGSSCRPNSRFKSAGCLRSKRAPVRLRSQRQPPTARRRRKDRFLLFRTRLPAVQPRTAQARR